MIRDFDFASRVLLRGRGGFPQSELQIVTESFSLGDNFSMFTFFCVLRSLLCLTSDGQLTEGPGQAVSMTVLSQLDLPTGLKFYIYLVFI